MDFKQLNHLLGNADLLLIDQILRGKFGEGIRMLDAGCGEGRNMVYFIRQGYSIYGIDQEAGAVNMARMMASSINRSFTVENIFRSTIEENPFPDGFFDVVICINVLQHARSQENFNRIFEALLRVLKNKGMLYLVMESDPESGEETDIQRPEGNRDAVEKMYLTDELLNRILSWDKLMKADRIRTHHIEGHARQHGLWLRKKGA